MKRRVGLGNYDFDIDFPYGTAAESFLKELLGTGRTIEVKREMKVSTTGNIAVEFECRGRPSGIAKTKAHWWAYVLEGDKYGHDIVIMIRTARLKQLARELYRQGRWVSGGDKGSNTKMVLVSLSELVMLTPSDVQRGFLI